MRTTGQQSYPAAQAALHELTEPPVQLLQGLRQPRRPEAGPPPRPGLGLQLGPVVPGNVAWAAAAQEAPPTRVLLGGAREPPRGEC